MSSENTVLIACFVQKAFSFICLDSYKARWEVDMAQGHLEIHSNAPHQQMDSGRFCLEQQFHGHREGGNQSRGHPVTRLVIKWDPVQVEKHSSL